MRQVNYLILIGLVLFFGSCKKNNDTSVIQKTMPELNIPADFDWKMVRPVMFHITGTHGQVITLKTADESKTIYKGIILPGQNKHEFSLSLPTFMKELKINGTLVQITGNDISFNIPSLKSVLLTNYNLEFDGVNDYVDMGDPPGGELDFGVTDFTCEAWVNTTDATIDYWYRRIFGKGFGFSCYIFTDGTIRVYYNSVSSSSTTAMIATGVWTHVAVVRTGSNIKIYINGILDLDETKAAWGGDLSSGDDFRIGNLIAGAETHGHWHGYIDEVRIWNSARTAAEILANYNKLVSPAAPNLVGYWRFDEGSGTTTDDLSANGNDGTISGCTWNAENK